MTSPRTPSLTEGRRRYQEVARVVRRHGADHRSGVPAWPASVGWPAICAAPSLQRREARSTLPMGALSGNVGSRAATVGGPRQLNTVARLRSIRSHAGARVRLAWVHLLTRDARVWEDVSAQFLETADTEARMLARLIRGTAAEQRAKTRRSRLPNIVKPARSMPESQTACLAVSSAQALNGRLRRAPTPPRPSVSSSARDPDHVDPWTLFRLGLMDATTTRWLRDEARRP